MIARIVSCCISPKTAEDRMWRFTSFELIMCSNESNARPSSL